MFSGLVWAAGKNNRDLVSLLLSHGAKVDSGDKYGTTPLIWVIIRHLYSQICLNTQTSYLDLELEVCLKL